MNGRKDLAFTYTTTLDLSEVLTSVGDCINIYIPVPHFIRENHVLTEQRVYGSRPYSIHSDMVAICAHMGILLPGEKSKKLSHEVLVTSLNAPLCGHVGHHDETRKLEENFGIMGVLVKVIAVSPPEAYNSSRGTYMQSLSIEDDSPIAIDIVDYVFIIDGEDLPKIVEDPKLAVYPNAPLNYFTPINEEDLLSFDYSPDLFNCDENGDLLKDFKVIFYVGEKELSFKITNNMVSVIQSPNSEEEEEKELKTGIKYSDILFLDDSIKIDNMELKPIDKVMLLPPDASQEE